MSNDRFDAKMISMLEDPGPKPAAPSTEDITRFVQSPTWAYIKWFCQNQTQQALLALVNGSELDDHFRGEIAAYSTVVNAPIDLLNEPKLKEPDNEPD